MNNPAQLSDEHLRTVVAAAILQHMPEEAKNALFTKAVANVLEVKQDRPNYYGAKATTQLEDAFRLAVVDHVRMTVKTLIAEDKALRDRIELVVKQAVAKAVLDDALVDVLARGIIEVFQLRDR